MVGMPAAAADRRTRRRDLVKATRQLFDDRGMQDAPIEEVAKAVGIARGLIYREFSSKDELFALTVTDYLEELRGILDEAIVPGHEPSKQLRECTRAYAHYCERYPAFLDCSLSLMQRPAMELSEEVSESVWLHLGQGMIGCIDQLAAVLRRGKESGAFEVEDPDYSANVLWTMALGAMHLARIGVGLRAAGPTVPELFRVSGDDVVESLVETSLRTVRA
jgi:AcrR family transcriptional regulator